MMEPDNASAGLGPAVGQGKVKEFVAGLLPPGPDGPAADRNLIGLLQQVQDEFGYLPATALQEIGRRMRIPLSRIYGVVSFYAQFYTVPRGRHTIRCCRGTACHVRGGRMVLQAVRKTLGIEDGQTTPDMMFSFETVACLGACALSPVMVVDTTYHGKVTPHRVEEVLRELAERAADTKEVG